MRNPRYLALSRHGLYYFRFPIPAAIHPEAKASDLKLSLKTRCPRQALQLGQCLMYLGNTLLSHSALNGMDYIDLKRVLTEHFTAVLQKRTAQMDSAGRLDTTARERVGDHLKLLNSSIEHESYDFVGTDEELSSFANRYSLPVTQDTDKWEQFRHEYVKASAAFFKGMLDHDTSLGTYDLKSNVITSPKSANKNNARLLKDAIAEYLLERANNKELTLKSLDEVKSQLNLLSEYLGDGMTLDISIDLARGVKNMLQRLPKHSRSKPALKKIPLHELAALPDTHAFKQKGTLSQGSVTKHINTYKTFFSWASDAKYIDENNFSTMKVKVSGTTQKREAFNKEQIDKIVSAALEEKRLQYKWGVIIGRYTGARLEEVSQMHITDIEKIDNIWCFKFNNDAKNKRIKTSAGNRITPIHSKLIELGLLDYISEVKSQNHQRLLYQLPHTGKNGHGRNLGRYFNERLLPQLGIKKPTLVFHSFRHTVITEMNREDIPEPMIKDIVGHERDGVTMKVYAKNYKTSQLKDAVEKIGLWAE